MVAFRIAASPPLDARLAPGDQCERDDVVQRPHDEERAPWDVHPQPLEPHQRIERQCRQGDPAEHHGEWRKIARQEAIEEERGAPRDRQRDDQPQPSAVSGCGRLAMVHRCDIAGRRPCAPPSPPAKSGCCGDCSARAAAPPTPPLASRGEGRGGGWQRQYFSFRGKIVLDKPGTTGYTPRMNTPRHQPLSERFASIMQMMLGILRAHGWRCLLHLPTYWLAMRTIRELFEALGALAAAFEAGTLPPIPPAPELAPLEPLPPRPASASARPRTRTAARPRAKRPPTPQPRLRRSHARVRPAAAILPLPPSLDIGQTAFFRENPALAAGENRGQFRYDIVIKISYLPEISQLSPLSSP